MSDEKEQVVDDSPRPKTDDIQKKLMQASSGVSLVETVRARHDRATTFDPDAEPIPDVSKFAVQKNRYFHNAIEEHGKHIFQMEDMKRIVFIDFKIKHIDSVKTTEETFRGHFHFYFTWLATQKEYQSWKRWSKTDGNYGIEWIPRWMPLIRWTNRVAGSYDFVREHGKNPIRIKPGDKLGFNTRDDREVTENLIGFDYRKGQFIRCQYEADMTFAEEFELQNFPVDCQDLGIHAQSFDSTQIIDFLPLPRGVFCRVDPEDSVLDEWDLRNMMVEFRHSSPGTSRKGRLYAEILVQLKVQRRWTAFRGHMLTSCVMCGLALVAFFIDSETSLGERLTYLITLLLADVANQQVIFSMLPNIPYATLLDKYLYFCFSFISLITGYSSFTIWPRIAAIDFWVGIGMFGFFLVAHLTFLTMGVMAQKQETMKLYLPTSALERYMSNRAWFRSHPKLELVWRDVKDSELHSDANGDIIFSPSIVGKRPDFPTKEMFEAGFRAGTSDIKILSDMTDMIARSPISHGRAKSEQQEKEEAAVKAFMTTVYSALGDDEYFRTIYTRI